MKRWWVFLLLFGWLSVPCLAGASGRSVALIIDTSGSMSSSDQPRYTAQIAQILGDLLADTDELTVIRLGGSSGCSAGPSSQLALRLDPRDRAGFKRQLDAMISYSGGNDFAAPVRTAIAALGNDSARERMLLMVADSGGLGSCDGVLTAELMTLHATGATIAAVNLGSTAGAFDSNPAFDLTKAALDAERLVEAVAAVYQKFLGAKQAQTGQVSGPIGVEIPPFIREAYLVVAADGPVPAIASGPGNPVSAGLDLDYRGGGETRGLDAQVRGYRMVRIEAPEPGRWNFEVAGLQEKAGWLLLLDSSIGLRLASQPVLARGVASPIEVEIYDQSTGKRIDDPSRIQGLELNFELDGRQIPLRNDGQGGDRVAGDGILTGELTADRTGQLDLPVRLGSDYLDRSTNFSLEVKDATWRLVVTTPHRSVVNEPLVLTLDMSPIGDRSALRPPEQIDVLTGGPALALKDDGVAPDNIAGDFRYTGSWAPTAVGSFQLDYIPRGGSPTPGITAGLEVVGELVFGEPKALELGSGGSGTVLAGRLELTGTSVKGKYEVGVTSNFHAAGSELEIDLGRGFEPIGEKSLPLTLTQTGARDWPVRLRVSDCPDGVDKNRRFTIELAAKGPEGQKMSLSVPLVVEVIEDPWLVCWWPTLAIIAGCLLAALVVYGFVSPSRFPAHLGVVISPEEDLEEGMLHHIRSQPGAGSGFFRDARIYVCPYRLSRRHHGALARLRAESGRILIEPVDGAPLWRRTLDDTWEPVAQEESPARIGTLYRNELKSLFFAVRGS